MMVRISLPLAVPRSSSSRPLQLRRSRHRWDGSASPRIETFRLNEWDVKKDASLCSWPDA